MFLILLLRFIKLEWATCPASEHQRLVRGDGDVADVRVTFHSTCIPEALPRKSASAVRGGAEGSPEDTIL